MAEVRSIATTTDRYANSLLSGEAWADSDLTFSFPSRASYYGSNYLNAEPSSGFQSLNGTQESAVRKILNGYEAVSNLNFNEITESSLNHGDLRFAESTKPSTAWAYSPSEAQHGGDIWLNTVDYNSPQKGNYAYFTLIHEIGHALGLKHPHEVEGGFAAMPTSHDTMEYTVMSYRSYVGAGSGYANEEWGFAQSLMMDDIAAIQTMYGADYSTNDGSSRYTWSASTGEMFINGASQGRPGGNQIFLTVWDGGGNDTYDLSTYFLKPMQDQFSRAFRER